MGQRPAPAGAIDTSSPRGTPLAGDPDNSRGSSGGRDGFEVFYEATYRRLAVQLHAYLGDRAEAEDVVQEAYIRAWQRWSAISRYDEPFAWVRRVAWNLATSRLRRLARAARLLRQQRPVTVAPAPSPDHVALVAALRRLPERQRRAVVLHHLADLPVASVATELGVPKNTVLSWLHRGRAQLAAYLTETDSASRPNRAADDNPTGR
jgi:RNA polymerase sigma-70 factor (ECF subfamily)